MNFLNTKLIAFFISCIVVVAGVSYLISTTQISTLQTRITELETTATIMANNYNNLSTENTQLNYDYDLLNAKYNLLNESLAEKTITIQLLQQQMNSLNQTYLTLLERYENLTARTLHREMYVAEETQNITIDPVPAGVRRHYTLINIPIPEDAGQDVVLVHFDKDGLQLAVPFYYFMDINATSKSVVSSGYFPFPCQILEYRTGENTANGYLYIQAIYTPTEQGYICEAGDHLAVQYPTSPKGLAEVTVIYWDEKL